MNFLEFKNVVLSSIKANDQYSESKTRQLRNWCFAFFPLFRDASPSHCKFVSYALSDEDCWEKNDSVHCVKLKRRMIAKILVQLQRWKSETNPLNVFERFRAACWCCLEEDIVSLFDHIKRRVKVEDCDSSKLKKLVTELSKASWSDNLVEYWLYVVAGYSSDLPLKDMHLYEYGLNISLKKAFVGDKECCRGHVEGVEFFWNKIKSLPEDEFSAHRKHEILIKAAVTAVRRECSNNPEIFEFFITQISSSKCREFLKREAAENKEFYSFRVLWYLRRFDQMHKLFDSFQPDEVTENFYLAFLNTLNVLQFSKNDEIAAANLFMHVWMEEAFDKHRKFVLKNEMCNSNRQGVFLLSFTRKNYMKPVWAILDKATRDQIKEFMNSKYAGCIANMLKIRGDLDSLNKFVSYKCSEFEMQSPLLCDVNFIEEPKMKRHCFE